MTTKPSTSLCVHEWSEKIEEFIRRELTDEQREKIVNMQSQFPPKTNRGGLGATLTYKQCNKCALRQLLDYKLS